MKRIVTIGLFGLGLSIVGLAHEIPARVTVRVFLKPQPTKLELLVRVPLEAMRDFQFPTREGGFLDLTRTDPMLRQAAVLWISDYVRIYEEDTLVGNPVLEAARVSLPTDTAFTSFETARTHVEGPSLSSDTEIYWNQALLDVLFTYPIRSQSSRFWIDPQLQQLGLQVVNVIRFVAPDGVVHALDFPGNPGRIPLDPSRAQVMWRFLELGCRHILGGFDHLLFLFCLVLPFRRLRSLVALVTSFTVAHSITLIASAIGQAPDALWFPPLIEVLIALSILYMAFENIVGARLHRRQVITFGFGLIHGFGFSFLLRETFQFGGAHLVTSLLAFNIGVELGQLLVLVLLIPAFQILFRYGLRERLGTILLSALVAHSAWHWMTERGGVLLQFGRPSIDTALAASLLRLLILLVLVAATVWLWSTLRRTNSRSGDAQ